MKGAGCFPGGSEELQFIVFLCPSKLLKYLNFKLLRGYLIMPLICIADTVSGSNEETLINYIQ